jgi:Flagella basal body rod protein
MDFLKSMAIAASGLKAQSGRMRVIAENIANAESTAQRAGADPYRRKIPTFKSEMDRALNAQTIGLGRVRTDQADFRTKCERLCEISQRQFDGRNDRHARSAAVLRSQPQRHRRDAPHDPAHHRPVAVVIQTAR